MNTYRFSINDIGDSGGRIPQGRYLVEAIQQMTVDGTCIGASAGSSMGFDVSTKLGEIQVG